MSARGATSYHALASAFGGAHDEHGAPSRPRRASFISTRRRKARWPAAPRAGCSAASRAGWSASAACDPGPRALRRRGADPRRGLRRGAGAAVGGLTGALVGMGVTEYEARRYEGKLREGNILISVHTDDGDQRDRVQKIFESAGARTSGRRASRRCESRSAIATSARTRGRSAAVDSRACRSAGGSRAPTRDPPAPVASPG